MGSILRALALDEEALLTSSDTSQDAFSAAIDTQGDSAQCTTSAWSSSIVFRPREGELGLLTISRRFDNERLARHKQDEGSDLPMGARII